MLKIDLHVHTIASGHAFCTVFEYINRAKELKMKIIGFADHGPANSETIVSEIYFKELRRIPKIIKGIRILKGIEGNITNDGEIDISDHGIEKLDYVIAGLHKHAEFKDRGKVKNTISVIKAIKSGKINIISHPFIMNCPIDIEAIAETACKNNVLLEVNISYLNGNRPELQQENLCNVKKMIAIVRKYKQKIIIGSDSHNIWELGDDSALQKIKKEIGLTDNLIINNYPKELFKLLKINE